MPPQGARAGTVQTPMLDKLLAVKDKSQPIGAFLDWLTHERGIVLGEQHEHSQACREPGRYRHCGFNETGSLAQSYVTITGLLAEYFEIDEQQAAGRMTIEPVPTLVRGDTPYWEYGCGCKASAIRMEPCPTHREAPAMLELLRKLAPADLHGDSQDETRVLVEWPKITYTVADYRAARALLARLDA